MEHISNSDQTDVGESSESHHQILISNIISKIESLPKVVNVDHVDYPPVDQNDIQAWERKHTCSMPDDLKAFYMLSNGFLLTWSVLFDGQKQSLGRMVVNSLKSLKRINDNKNINGSIALDDIVCSDNDECGNRKPQFDPSQSWIFELDDCDGYGKVCLVYKLQSDSINQISPEVWFLDRALGWHYLTDSFTKYFRLMIMHLGLPQWQYALTNIGLSPIAKKYCRTR
ncbi:uncharacterized protein TRIADDRAFT_54743 [Trichoplax adhaerens]|uniref:Knr4/Smi1-like domain-containing protein n=1 Tax=Trichoplax adhaerens TaxID=10228 RepID=B3RSV5_TRIAD|nr:hypothetical protein TRIADDRAFT_54743 [Trichoplax adhaerens]EDV26589.1 hypothetical protein TRIADDRAFT_54743 [Trichoplax adhaerens]|eukprot:XP_002110585.1 hypothetical protein TRIADDRAFT_54743 [Trichoplax adhaerens]